MLVLRFGLGRCDHALFFRCGLFLLELRFLGILGVFFIQVFFGLVLVMIPKFALILVHAGIRSRISRREPAILRIPRRVIILSVRNMLSQRRGFLFGQIHVRMLVVMPAFRMPVNFRRITQFEIRAQRFHLIPITRILRRRLLHMRIGRRQGIHFRSRRHQRRKWREANRVRHGRVVLRLACLGFGSLWLSSQRFRREMRMRLPLRERLSRQRLQTAR